MCRSILEEDSEPQVAPDGQAGALHVRYEWVNEFFWEFFLVFLEGLGWLRGSSMGVYVKPSVTCLCGKRAIQIHFDLNERQTF